MPPTPPPHATAALMLADGSVFWGQGLGAAGPTVGEVCFNTSMTGYQEVMTDPSYASQIINFTFPHIGNVGANLEDDEAINPAAAGVILREAVTAPSNWRATASLDEWLRRHGIVGMTGIDSRALTRRIRDKGAPHGCLMHAPDGQFDLDALHRIAAGWPGLTGMDLALSVTCAQTYHWDETPWRLGEGYGVLAEARHHVVAIDYGAKRNILRRLAAIGARVTVVRADSSFEEIMAHKPDGIFLSNGPGDPAATYVYAGETLGKLVESGIPIFGICLGHQLLALTLGGKTAKLPLGHRGANHPVKDLQSGKVEITSQNHGFHVLPESLPEGVEVTHVSLFDGTNEGLAVKGRPIFSVQYHPEASPGPHDSRYLFDRFSVMMERFQAG